VTRELLAALLVAAAVLLAAAPSSTGSARLAALTRARRPETDRSVAWWLLPVVVAAWWGLVAAALTAGAVLAGRRVVFARRRASDEAAERAGVLDALALLAADLRAGRTPDDALSAAAGVACGRAGTALAAAVSTARLGGDVGATLQGGGSAVPDVLRGLGACWQVCHDSGIGLAASVERLEEAGRAAQSQRRAVAAELAGPTATAQLLAVLPVAGVVLAAALGARPGAFLLHTPVGVGCLLVGLALDGAGLLWTRRLTAAALR
jgi:tight adherence protein B